MAAFGYHTRNIKTVCNADVRSYGEAEEFLGGSDARQIGENVKIVRLSPDSIAVRFYYTDIVTYFADGTFIADNGGKNTPSTSSRATQFGPRGWTFWHSRKKLVAYGPGASAQYQMGVDHRYRADTGDEV